MDEVAEAAAHAALAAVEAAAGLAEIGHGRQLAVDRAGRVPAAVEGVARVLRRVLVLEARVHVADQIWIRIAKTRVSYLRSSISGGRGGGGAPAREQLTVVVVVAYHDLLRLAVLAHFAPKVLVEGVEMVLQLRRIHLVLGVVGRVLV